MPVCGFQTLFFASARDHFVPGQTKQKEKEPSGAWAVGFGLGFYAATGPVAQE